MNQQTQPTHVAESGNRAYNPQQKRLKQIEYASFFADNIRLHEKMQLKFFVNSGIKRLEEKVLTTSCVTWKLGTRTCFRFANYVRPSGRSLFIF